jgi:hypothetical protein
MGTVTNLRERYKQAQDLYKGGKYAQAKALVADIQHERVYALIKDCDARLAESKSGAFPPALIFGVVGFVLLIVVSAGVAFFMMRGERGGGAEAQAQGLPTLWATSTEAPCTSDIVLAWFVSHNLGPFDEFYQLSELAFVTPAGPESDLDALLVRLQQVRASVPLSPMPACAAPEVQTRFADYLAAMDRLIVGITLKATGDLTQNQLVFDHYTAYNEGRRRAMGRILHQLQVIEGAVSGQGAGG